MNGKGVDAAAGLHAGGIVTDMTKMFPEELSAKIGQAFGERAQAFGRLRKEITEEVNRSEGLTRTFLQYIYCALPLSDAGDYPVSLFKEYAEHAAFLWENSPFADADRPVYFLRYVLFPRVNSEDLTSHRRLFYEELKDRAESLSAADAVLEINNWCFEQATYHSTSARTASPITLQKCGFGRCGEESVLLVSALRSVGIIARQVYVPRWSHTESNHAWVEYFVDGEWHFTGACEPKPIADNGWFTYAASRSAVVHSRLFSGGLFLPLAGDEGELIGYDGGVAMLNQTPRYASVRELEILVRESHLPVSGAKVSIEIVNGGVFFPVAVLRTDEAGSARLKLGIGGVHIRVVSGKKEAEEFLDVRDTGRAELSLHSPADDADWKPFRLITPDSDYVAGKPMSAGDEAAQNARNTRAEAGRRERITSYADPKLSEKYSSYPQISRVLGRSFGNLPEIKAFLEECGDPDKAERLFSSLTQKDCRDVTKEVLLDHLSAYEEEECKKSFSGNGQAGEDGAAMADEESVFSGADMTAEFYRAPMDPYTRYVASPRIWIERLTPFRKEIKAILGRELGEAGWEAVKAYVDEHITVDEDREYTTISTSPLALLKLGRGSRLSGELLFISLCRCFGIPARLNGEYRKAEVKAGGEFVFADGTERTATVRVSFTGDSPEEARRSFSLSYKNSEGDFVPLHFHGLYGSGSQAELTLLPGTYRAVASVRLQGGSVSGKVRDFTVKEGGLVSVTVEQEKAASLRDEPAKREIAPVTLTEKKSGEELASSSWEGMRLWLFLRVGQEPTTHVLNELISLGEIERVWPVPVGIITSGEGEEKEPLAVKAIGLSGAKLYEASAEAFCSMTGFLPCEAADYPYFCVTKDQSEIFSAHGYQAGLIELLYQRLG